MNWQKNAVQGKHDAEAYVSYLSCSEGKNCEAKHFSFFKWTGWIYLLPFLKPALWQQTPIDINK